LPVITSEVSPSIAVIFAPEVASGREKLPTPEKKSKMTSLLFGFVIA